MTAKFLTDANIGEFLKGIEYTRCSELGMTLDDADSKNIDKLAAAINGDANGGANIIVDGVYRLKAGNVTIDKDVILKGADADSGFRYEGEAEKVFNITKNVRCIDVHGLSFVNNRGGETAGVLFYNTSSGENDLNIEKFSVCNCSFDGNFSLYRRSGNRLYNSSATLSTVKEFIFSKNSVKEQRNSFCDLSDTCFESVEITHNRINNFLHAAFNFATENLPGSPTASQTEKYNRLQANKGKIFADNNYVFCDDDCVLDEETGYYSFLVAECNAVVYTNNHIEGMKASYNAPVYDAYLSAANVTAEHNVWKNNLCFAPTPSGEEKNTYLMKAKMGGGIKTYRKNTYYITEDFLAMLQEKYAANLENCYVGLVSITDDSNWDITENYIEIASALLFFSANVLASRFAFYNNVVIANDIKAGLLVPKDANTETLFVNNVIRSENSTNTITLCGQIQPGGSCQIINNKIVMPKASIYGTGNPDNIYKQWVVHGNYFEANMARYFTFADFLDNEIVANRVRTVCKEQTLDSRQRFTTHMLNAENDDPIIHITFGEQSAVMHIGMRKVNKTTGAFTLVSLTIRVYRDSANTQKIKATNDLDGTVIYDGVLHPTERFSEYIFDYSLRLTLESSIAELVSNRDPKSVCYIERETIITE